MLASPEYLSLRNLSVAGLLAALALAACCVSVAGGVKTFVVTPAAINALSALADALDWRLIYGLNLTRGKPEAMAGEAAYVARAAGPRLLAFQIGNDVVHDAGQPQEFHRFPGNFTQIH